MHFFACDFRSFEDCAGSDSSMEFTESLAALRRGHKLWGIDCLFRNISSSNRMDASLTKMSEEEEMDDRNESRALSLSNGR